MDMTWRTSKYSNVNGGDCVEVGTWRTSTHSTTNGGDCVEVGAATAATSPGVSPVGGGGRPAPWRTSTHSTTNGGACVEAATISATVAVRDTKDDGHGPVLRFTPGAWATFTTSLR